jgi:glycosyltransferase involved in cell wall biosynthesis
MIVRDEAPVIRRCLLSVLPLIDTFVIVDTGSTDETLKIARETLGSLQGAFYERPWVNFAVNRSEALEFAYTKPEKSDYVLIIDADEVLSIPDGFELPVLDKHAYSFPVYSGDIVYYKIQLVDNSLEWEYRCPVHEYIYSPQASSEGVLDGIRTFRYADGARARDPLTYKKDALLLEKALLEEPNNTRYVFYLAQSYRDAGELDLALRYYRRRGRMGGWIEEVYYSKYQVAELKARLGDSAPEVLTAYLDAFRTKPSRMEPLYRIGLYYSSMGEYDLAYLFLSRAMTIPFPENDRLYVERDLYRFLLPLEFAVSAFYVGYDDEALDVYDALLAERELPDPLRALGERNRKFSLDRLGSF